MRFLSIASKVAARRRVPARRPIKTPLSREIARLRAHFRDVLGELRARDVAQLSLSQRAARARLIEELERYARAGRFPRNLDFPGARVPCFVDALNTRCAVAHLLEFTGEAALVARIRATQNNALVPAFAGDPALVAWLEQAGLTAAEAVRIQPSYCFIDKASVCFCDRVWTAYSAVAEATVTMKLDATSVHVRIDAVHGDASVATVGQELDVGGTAAVGETVIFAISPPLDGGMGGPDSALRIATNGTVELKCSLTVPALKKADAIAALLAPATTGDPTSGCTEHLASVDSVWGESQCENSGGGCSITASGGASSLLLGTLAVGIAAWSRRRRRARRASRAPAVR